MVVGCLDRIQLASDDHSVLDMNKGLNLGCSQTSSVHNLMAAAMLKPLPVPAAKFSVCGND